MTTTEAYNYIKDKQIPLSFVGKKKIYYLRFWTEDTLTSGEEDCGYYYPNTFYSGSGSREPAIEYTFFGDGEYTSWVTIFEANGTNEEVISEFLYWFETNKRKFKKIKYYEQNIIK